MNNIEQRKRVVEVAREWIGTKYQHGARIKRVVCDCTFFAQVYEEAGVTGRINIEPYPSMAHLNRGSGQYLLRIKEVGREIEQSAALPGDIAMFHIARDFSHGGVINAHGWPDFASFDQAEGWPWIIHANLSAGFVLEERGDQAQLALAKAVKFFTLW